MFWPCRCLLRCCRLRLLWLVSTEEQVQAVKFLHRLLWGCLGLLRCRWLGLGWCCLWLRTAAPLVQDVVTANSFPVRIKRLTGCGRQFRRITRAWVVGLIDDVLRSGRKLVCFDAGLLHQIKPHALIAAALWRLRLWRCCLWLGLLPLWRPHRS